jgi:peptidoglycan hydrolase-like protein with peptidoglycan-binding domain
MGVVAARFLFLAFLGLTGTIIYNALYLQDPQSTGGISARKARPGPAAAPGTAVIETVKLPPVSTDLPPLHVEEGAPRLLVKAVQRELVARGFDVGAEDGRLSQKTRIAISAYEQKHGLPITGLATDELLRHILLGEAAKPAGATGSVAAPAEALRVDPKDEATVKQVQQALADLGYAPGPIDGAAGGTTKRAIIAFQRDRRVAETGQVTADLLQELKRVTGEDPAKTASRP